MDGIGRALVRALVIVAAVGMLAGRAAAQNPQDQLYFSSNTNVTDILVSYINKETVGLDVSSWYLSEHAISIAIANRWAAGVPVRIIGDRAALFENDPHTKAEFYWLANQGIPIRLRFNPTWFPEIDHWKAAIFVGQNMVEFGSGNFAPTELAPVDAHNFDDDSEMFTTDPALVGAFRTKFDTIWNDTTTEPHSIIGGPPYLKDWNDACANEPTGGCADYHTQYPNPAPMVVNTARQEPDNPMPADLYWGQGTEFNARMVQEVNNENSMLDIIIYRLEVSDLTQALLNRFQAGVPVRMIVDPAQYTNNTWPEYWLTHANIDRLYAAGVPILQRTHAGVTHIKTLITSSYATNASSNFAPNWQRDNDYFVSSATKPDIYQGFVDRFNAMWADTSNFGPFVPTPPNAVDTSAAGTAPSPGQNGVSVGATFTWNTASWATSYDIYLGPSPSAMTLVANVPAQLVQNPPVTYSWTPASPLNFGATYYWKVVSRAFSGLTTSSSNQMFSTAAAGSQPPTAPANPAPSSGTTGLGGTTTLSWSSAGAASYAIMFGTTNPPPATGTSTSSPSYSPGTLAASTTYYWQIVATNGAGSTSGPVWSFATSASNLPSPWQSQDVGATGQAGSSLLSAGTFTISGAGADIWGTTDAFQFAYQPLAGDGAIIARVTGMQNTGSSAKAGIMLRAATAAGAAHVILDLNPTGNIEFMSRATTGGSTSWLAGASHAAPVWLKLALTGSTVVGSISADGVAWTQVGTTTISFPPTIDAGLVVNSHDTSTLNTATFDAVSIANSSAPGAPASPTPATSATGVSTSPTLTWTSAGATSYDVAFGQSSSPALVSSGQPGASYSPGALTVGTTYFWQITAHDSAGTTAGPLWSFTTVPAPSAPGTPAAPNPANASSGISTSAALAWTSSGATSYDVFFGAANPPAQVTTGQSAASYAPSSLTSGTTYFWQIAAHNGSGTTTGPVWSFTTAAASTLPSPWESQDVGAVGQPGSATFSSGQFTVSGAGADIWGAADAFQFVNQPLNGDGEILARVLSLQNTNSNAKAGVMMRESVSPSAAHVMLDVEPSGNIEFMTRSSDGAQTSWLAGASQTPPVWLRLTRTGTTITGDISVDGQTWTTVGSTTITLPSSALAGMIVTSHNTSALNTATFDSVAVVANGGTAPAPPAAPSPATGSSGVSTLPTLTWSASGASSYDVAFGAANPPPTVSTAQASASFTPASALNTSTTYFWQITAHNGAGATPGPVWSFTTAATVPPSPTDIVIYASDVPSSALHGMWSIGSDAASPNGVALVTPDNGWAATNNPSANPADYVDVTFTANAGVPYTLWMRIQALNDNKYNDSLWVQFSDALVNGAATYPLNSTSGLDVNLATDTTGASDQGWGWVNGGYWLVQPATFTFASSGTHTLRIQVREDGVEWDQIVLSPSHYFNASASCPTSCGGAPGPVSGDQTIVPKP